jgi:cytochrome P450
LPLLAERFSRGLFRNPKLFPEPDAFKPEQFLKDGKLHISGPDPSHVSFGFGRR